jgi:nicotinate-nucleotide adenylyltransferase
LKQGFEFSKTSGQGGAILWMKQSALVQATNTRLKDGYANSGAAMLKTLCLGGSFNPIHHGHLICARAAAECANFNRVLFIPSSQPPHKPADPALASVSDRLAMTRAAIEGYDTFDVDALEIGRAGPSYTIDTARALKQRGFDQVHWLIGADTLPQLPTWREPEALLQEVTFWIVDRPGNPIDWSTLPTSLQPLRGRLLILPQIEISATDIRRRVKNGQSIEFLTPSSVVTYIEEHRLYGYGDARRQ